MSKEKFQRNKPHVNIGTIGHIDHGKTTLTAAITKHAALKGNGTYVPFDEIDNRSDELIKQKQEESLVFNSAENIEFTLS